MFSRDLEIALTCLMEKMISFLRDYNLMLPKFASFCEHEKYAEIHFKGGDVVTMKQPKTRGKAIIGKGGRNDEKKIIVPITEILYIVCPDSEISREKENERGDEHNNG